MSHEARSSIAPIVESGVSSLVLRVADITLSARSVDPDLRLTVDPVTRRFLSPDAVPDLLLAVKRTDLDSAPRGEMLFDSGASWRLGRLAGGDLLFSFFSAPLGPIPYKQARISPDWKTGEILLHAPFHPLDEPAEVLQFPLDELLFHHLLATRGWGVELHACGVLDPSGKGFLFAGQSGDGKTTTARLWRDQGATVLSDDRIIVRKENGAFWMYGTPWHGEEELAENLRTKLSGIFILARGDENRLLDVSPVEAISALVARSFVPFHSREPMENTLAFLEGLVGAVPCRTFAFVPDGGAVSFVRAQSVY